MPGLNNKQCQILTFEDKLVKNIQIKINSINSSTLSSGKKIYFIWSKKVLDGNTLKIVINNFEWLCNPNELKKQIVVLCGHWGKSGWTIPYSIKKNGVDLIHPTYKDKKYLRMEKYFSNNSTAIDDEEQSMIDRIFEK